MVVDRPRRRTGRFTGRASSSIAFVVVATLALAACAGGDGYRTASPGPVSPVQAAWQDVGPDGTVFLLPGRQPATRGGDAEMSSPTALLGQVRRYDLGEIHRLVLSNDTSLRGENELVARIYPEQPGLPRALMGPSIESQMPRLRLDDSWLADRLSSEFPAALAPSSVLSGRNAYGPYNYVVLSGTPGYVCHFAWQELGARSNGYRTPGGLAFVQIELRYCASGDSATAGTRQPVVFARLGLRFMPSAYPGRYVGRGDNVTRHSGSAIHAFGREY
jgi:hypothetical protein